MNTIGWLILLADTLWFELDGQRWTLYLMAVRSTTGGKAHFLDPVLLPGRETGAGWDNALASMPPEIENRILSLVSDGFRGVFFGGLANVKYPFFRQTVSLRSPG